MDRVQPKTIRSLLNMCKWCANCNHYKLPNKYFPTKLLVLKKRQYRLYILFFCGFIAGLQCDCHVLLHILKIIIILVTDSHKPRVMEQVVLQITIYCMYTFRESDAQILLWYYRVFLCVYERQGGCRPFMCMCTGSTLV